MTKKQKNKSQPPKEIPKKHQEKFQEVKLTFPSNTRVRNILGTNDQNLRYLKTKLQENNIPAEVTFNSNELKIQTAKKNTPSLHHSFINLYEISASNPHIDSHVIDSVLAKYFTQLNTPNTNTPTPNTNTNTNTPTQIPQPNDSNNNLENYNPLNAVKLTPIIGKDFYVNARSPNQAKLIEKLKQQTIVFALGAAGCGKTHLALSHGLAELEQSNVAKLVLCRPAVDSGEKIGFLPGDIKEKFDPYVKPFFDILFELSNPSKIEKLILQNKIEISPLAYMRGRTYKKSIVILDEAQNCTLNQLMMFFTRIGENSQYIICADPEQSDLTKPQQVNLIKLSDKMIENQEIDRVIFNNQDIVRHHLINHIIKSFAQYKKNAPNQ